MLPYSEDGSRVGTIQLLVHSNLYCRPRSFEADHLGPTMRSMLLGAVFALGATSHLMAAPPAKTPPKSDFEAAVEKAKKEKKHVALVLNLFG